jgi:phosphatidylethanolamine/phosphatidyl-N-methylethanolamine N-methyltransferase
MQLEAAKSAYRRYANVYDALFGPVLQAGRKAVMHELQLRRGERVLEVGVGTGLSLPLYPPDVRVTGIDVSGEMLAKARARVQRERLWNVDALLEMDAQAMSFPDASFDKVVAMYVISVVAHPERLLAELRRVCRPGGEIFIVNHVRSDNRAIAAVEKALARFSDQLGFHPDFELRQLAPGTAVLDEISRINFFWKVLRLRPLAGETGTAPG